MLKPILWKKLLSQPSNRGALSFVAGLSHGASRKNYCETHFHEDVEIVYHPTGSGTTHLGGEKVAFGEGSAVVYAAREPHDQAMLKDGEDLCVQIALPARLRSKLHEGFLIPRIDRPWLTEEIQDLCRNQAQPLGLAQHVFNLRASAILLALVDIATNISSEENLLPAQRHVIQAVNFINERFSTLNSLRDVAEHVGLSPDYLRHLFQEVRGESLIHHLNKVKIERAKILLTNSPLLHKQIATTCGFRDEYYFSKVFRKFTNFSPGAYRQKSAAKPSVKG